MTSERYEKIHRLTYENRELLLEEKECICIFCGCKFNVSEIEFWQEDPNGMTAECPSCWVDAVVPAKIEGEAISKEDLKRVHRIYFKQ